LDEGHQSRSVHAEDPLEEEEARATAFVAEHGSATHMALNTSGNIKQTLGK
jgi:hypothetical protein